MTRLSSQRGDTSRTITTRQEATVQAAPEANPIHEPSRVQAGQEPSRPDRFTEARDDGSSPAADARDSVSDIRAARQRNRRSRVTGALAAPATPAAAATSASLPSNPLSAAEIQPPPDERYEIEPHMAAYDHVVDALLKAGGKDGVIARDEAAGLVDGLRKDGLGTAALATEQLFDLVDGYDAARGARVTQADFERARPLLEMWLKSEEGARSPLGLTLAEHGRIEGFPPVFEHLAKRIPERGLQHIATLINGHKRGDGIVSRADAKDLVDTLKAQGRGTEAHGVDLFMRFMDHRDAQPGARITTKDINETIHYAREKLLENKDLNQDGYYQPNERDLFSASAKAFLHTGRLAMFGGQRPTLEGPDPQPRPAGPAQFDENNPLPRGFTAKQTIRDGTFRVDGQGKTTLSGITGSNLAETRLFESAFGAIWERSTRHRVDPPGSPAEVSRNGSMDFGTWDDPSSGTTYQVARWNDIDDDSRVFYFAEAPGSTSADPRFELAHEVFLN